MTAWKDKSLRERILDRHENVMVKERDYFDAQREEIVQYMRPDLTVDIKDSTKGKFAGSLIMEGTGSDSALTMANGLTGSMIGRRLEWLRYAMIPTDELARRLFAQADDDINQYLQNVVEHMMWVYRRSNYYETMPRYILDAITVGSPVLLAEEDPGNEKINFKRPYYTETYLHQNWFGEDDMFHGEIELSGLTASQQFMEEDLGENIRKQLERGDHNRKSKYIQAIYAAGDKIFDDLPNGETVNINRPWLMFYIKKTVEPKDKTILLRLKETQSLPEGTWEKSFSVWHYCLNKHESYARTPAWFAIFDVKGGNAAWGSLYDLAEKVGRPPTDVMEDRKGRVGLGAGAVNWVTAQQYDRPPKSIFDAARYPLPIEVIDRIKANVQRWFHTRLFRQLEDYFATHQQPPTAYQIWRMEAERFGLLGPAVEGIERALLAPVDSRCVGIEDRAGRLPKPPDVLLEYAARTGKTRVDIHPQFTGPISVAQQQFQTAQKIQTGLTSAEPFFKMDPDTTHKIRCSKGVEWVLEENQFPQNLIVPEDEYEEFKEAKQQAEAQEQLMENAPGMTQSVKNLQGETAEGSPLAALGAA